MSLKSWLIVVPARLASTRLEEKMLQDLGGKPVIVRVAENLKPLQNLGATLIVATDSQKIKLLCDKNGIPSMMTSASHQSGTDRCWEVAKASAHLQYVLNVQGDEPFCDPQDLVLLCRTLETQADADIATLVFPSADQKDFANPNVVKAVANHNGFAIYFSRSGVPFPRDNAASVQFLHHLGVYAYKRRTLETFCSLPQSKLEFIEKLEQLRAIDNGMKILLQNASHLTKGIDTREDLEAARARFR